MALLKRALFVSDCARFLELLAQITGAAPQLKLLGVNICAHLRDISSCPSCPPTTMDSPKCDVQAMLCGLKGSHAYGKLH